MKESLTDTELRLNHAAQQIKLAFKYSDQEKSFCSCVDSYITLARSVPAIMQEETVHSPRLLLWYKDQVTNLKKLPTVNFFNQRKNPSIYKDKENPEKKVPSRYKLNVLDLVEEDEALINAWKFKDVEKYIPEDSGNVLDLCRKHFHILSWFVSEWLRKRRELGIR